MTPRETLAPTINNPRPPSITPDTSPPAGHPRTPDASGPFTIRRSDLMLHTMRAIADAMRHTPGPDANPQERQTWLTYQEHAYQRIAADHMAIAAEARYLASQAHAQAAALQAEALRETNTATAAHRGAAS